MENNKITKATIESFIKRNADKLYIVNKFVYDQTQDGVRDCNSDWRKAVKTTSHIDYNLGFEGMWFVGSSRDDFMKLEDDEFEGYEVYNCIGIFHIGIKK